MAHAASTAPRGSVPEAARSAAPTYIPWFLWCCVIATTSAVIGGIWDISWHESIGRDSFWTPAHMFIYACGVLAGIACGYLILATTFDRNSPLRGASVQMWGFRAPLGAFIAAWGGVAMLVSAPFDNWWHNAYGLDVKVLSPPHVVLILGLMAVRFGTLILVLGWMNRASGALRTRLEAMFLYIGALVVGLLVGAFMEMTNRVFMHGARFYLVIAIIVPITLAAVVRASGHRWAATLTMGILTTINLLFVWILPLFPATPKLGPVYHQVTNFVPPDFPLLLIIPSILFDLLRPRLANVGEWGRSVVQGLAFLGLFLAVQWPFANFLLSSGSRNWVFGTGNVPYFTADISALVRNVFISTEPTAVAFAVKLIFAFVAAVISMRLGFAWGTWMQRIKR